jgi:crotonobetainyl-CoA:carnitine CoA-transferase CaiB-like acyl-CoA transferase
MASGPLEGLRVIDLTDDTGRFATKLLREAGASVVRIGRGAAGPAMREGDAQARGGLLDWWYDGGKARVDLDLSTEDGRDAYRRLARHADLIIETEPPGRLAELGVDFDAVSADNPRLVQVSLTPFGRTGPRAGWQTTDLVTAALGGVLSLSGLPDQPINPWGRQAFNFGGLVAAISGLAGVRAARREGIGQHVDISLLEAECTTVEQLLFQYWFDDVLPYPKIAQRQGSLHWIGAYKVVPAKTGWEMITPTPNFQGLMAWMVEEEFAPGVELASLPPAELVGRLSGMMDIVAEFAKTKDAGELFHAAQDRHIAFGEVQTVAQVAANPQHEFRRFFREVAWGGSKVVVPGPLARFHETPAPEPEAPAEGGDLDEILGSWAATRRDEQVEPGSLEKPLSGLRILDLSHVLAGPTCTRFLGDLGADVVKLQTVERATTVNDPKHPYFYTWNRSKRVITLNMKHERAGEIMRRMVERSDVLIENFSAGVLDRWGLSSDRCRSWNPRLVYVTMSGCGHEGPWSRLVTYAPTIHALCGLTYLSNPAGRGDLGPGFSLNDIAAGLSAAFAVLCALDSRDHSGKGQHVDLSQMEVGGYLIGPALVDFLTNGREAHPAGNRDPFGDLVPNDCYRTADGEWLAVSCRDDSDWLRLVTATGIEADEALAELEARRARAEEVDALLGAWAASVEAEAGQELLQGAGVPAGMIQNTGHLMADPQLLARGLWRSFDHPNFGVRPHDRYPALWSRMTLEPYQPAASYAGEHNFEVYPELLDLDEAAVAEAMGEGLFA